MKRTWKTLSRGLAAPMTILVLTMAGGGCRTPAPPPAPGAQVPEPAGLGLSRAAVPKAAVMDVSPLVVDEVAPETTIDVEEEAPFPERPEPELPTVTPGEYPENLIRGIKDPDEVVQVQLNLDATPLTDIVPLFAALLNFSYQIDASVKGAITMAVDSEMTAREAWQMFENILWLAGAYASRNPGFLHILPFSKMPQERRILAPHDPMANVEVAMIRILYVKSTEVLGHIKPFLTEGAQIMDLVTSNTLLIVEAPANMPKLRELIRRLDAKGEAAWPHICLPCREVDAETLREELEMLLPVLGLSVVAKGPSGGQVKLIALSRPQVIVASAALEEVLDEVARWCRVLDREDKSEKENVYFYNIEHSTAEQLSTALGTFFNATATSSGRPSQDKSTSAKAAASGRTAASRKPVPPSPRRELEEGERKTVFDTPVLVYADEISQRLVMRTTHRANAMVQALLERLDVPVGQVMIEAVIAEVTLNEGMEFGVSYAAAQELGGHSDGTVSAAVVNTAVPDTERIVDLVEGGTRILFKRGDGKLAFLRALASKTDVCVLSKPQIFARNDQEATISVGDDVPIITGDYTDVSTETSTRRNIEYKETGITLTVTPHVTAGNRVKLDVSQVVSDAVTTTSSGIDSPTIQEREIETSLVLGDGETVLLGGLIRTREENSYTGVPWLMEIPGLGRLFRTNVTVDDRTELLVLLTVNVIDSPETIETLAQRYRQALFAIQKERRGL